ncbi:MAG: hypothetical protein HGB34_04600 [Candidatus Moranbacteria bacterium]|nr:hypothetical protein [Candidatus Moranbacteria bacterium]
MKAKVFGTGVVLFGAVMLAGCSQSDISTGDGNGTPDRSEMVGKEVGKQAASGVADWISGLAAGKKMRCEYTMGEGGKTITAVMYMDKDRYRTEMDMPTGKMISLYDGTAMYSWAEEAKQGMKMDMKCMEDIESDMPTEDAPRGAPAEAPESYESPEDALGSIPDISCEEVSGSIDLSVPSDVVFTDQCEMMKRSMEQMKQMEGQIPDSVKGMMGGQ